MTFIGTRRSAQSRVWTPKDLGAGLSLCLEGFDLSTIIANGSNVSQWRDKSVYGNHVSQPTTGNQPLNLHPPAVQNTSGYLYNNSPNGLPLGTSDRTLLVVSSTYSGRNATEHIFSYGGSGANALFGIGNFCEGGSSNAGDSSSENYQIYNGSAAYGPLHSVLGVYNTVQMTTLSASNQNISLSNNGSNIFTGSMPYNTTSGSLNVFNDSGLGNAFQGLILAIYLCNTVDPKAVARLEGYAAWMLGLVSSLPSTHPYKFQPPRVSA